MQETEAYFSRVYRETFPMLAKVCVQKARRITDVDDLLQNTYTRFYKHLSKHGIRSVTDPKSYLYTILFKELSRYYRNAPREEPDSLEEMLSVPSGDPPCEDAAIDLLTLDEIWHIVETEPLLSQKVFVLYYRFDLGIREIADQLGLSEAAVKNRLFHTRNRIRIQNEEVKTHE